jgi:hypothetical protein
MTIIPVGDYRPDAPAYLGTHATVATNVYPRPDGSDGPLLAPVVEAGTSISTLFPVTTAFLARDIDGAVLIYIGVAETPFVYRKYGALFYSLITNFLGRSPTANNPNRFCQFGTRLMVVNKQQGLFWHTVGSFDAFTAIPTAPTADFIATVEPGFVVLGNINDGTLRPAGLRWSALNNALDWPVVGTSDAASKQSDDQDLPNGGAVMGILGAVGGAAAAVFTERSVYRMEYVGAPAVFAFRETVRGQGCMCKNASIAINGIAYFVSEQGFQRFDGQTVTPIGSGRVSQTFLDTVNREYLDRVSVAHDPNRKIIVWGSPLAGQDGLIRRWWVYSYATDRWRFSDDAAIGDFLFLLPDAETDATPMDFLDALYPGGMDTITASMDGATLNGGTPLLGGFTDQNEYCTFTGATLAALVETGETDSNGRRVFVTGIRPLTDAAAPTAALGYRETFNATVSYTPLTSQEVTGICGQRTNTRYARARVYIPAGAVWSYLQGADVIVQPAGKR